MFLFLRSLNNVIRHTNREIEMDDVHSVQEKEVCHFRDECEGQNTLARVKVLPLKRWD